MLQLFCLLKYEGYFYKVDNCFTFAIRDKIIHFILPNNYSYE